MQEMSRRILVYGLTLTLLLSAELAAAQQGDVRAVIEAGNEEFIAAFSRGDSAQLSDAPTLATYRLSEARLSTAGLPPP